MSPLVEDHIANLSPYVPGRGERDLRERYGVSEVAALASNENPLGPSPAVVEAIRRAASAVHRYPDGSGSDLKHALASRLSVSSEGIVLGNGSNELIELVVRTFLRPGETVVTPETSFVVFRLVAQSAGGRTEEVPNHGFAVDVPALVAAARRPGVRVLFLANPNNPTGAHIGAAQLRELIDGTPPDVIVVVDEAYIEYRRDPELEPVLTLAPAGRHVLSLRTFSKMHALAGLRIGYAATRSVELAEHLERVRQPFNVNAIAQAAGLAALVDVEHVERSREQVERGLAQLVPALEGLGLRVHPSQGNFVLVDVGVPSVDLAARLEHHGVLVRPMTGYGLPEFLRVTIGLEAEMELFLRALRAELAPSRV